MLAHCDYYRASYYSGQSPPKFQIRRMIGMGMPINHSKRPRPIVSEVARGHFTVRRLERAYGKEAVRKAYERFAQNS